MYINLLQLDTEHRNCFEGYYHAVSYGGIDLNDYELVFEGEVDCDDPEAAFRLFNLCPPDGYRGRSMSVSDVLCVDNGEGWDYYYCDRVDFMKFRPAKPADWTGRETEKRPSGIPHQSASPEGKPNEEILRCAQDDTGKTDCHGAEILRCAQDDNENRTGEDRKKI
ncbi:MAG: hypothetical protein IJV00_02715, partial [Clostridia bacterium]|nr:hypothetical protein [Clostridia bacterium]